MWLFLKNNQTRQMPDSDVINAQAIVIHLKQKSSNTDNACDCLFICMNLFVLLCLLPCLNFGGKLFANNIRKPIGKVFLFPLCSPIFSLDFTPFCG